MKGLGCAFLGIVFVAILTATGICAIATSLAGYGEAREQTRQAQILADMTAKVANIEANKAVKIAYIEADATKKTSWPFVGFYLLRALLWMAGVLWLLVGIKAVQRWILGN